MKKINKVIVGVIVLFSYGMIEAMEENGYSVENETEYKKQLEEAANTLKMSLEQISKLRTITKEEIVQVTKSFDSQDIVVSLTDGSSILCCEYDNEREDWKHYMRQISIKKPYVVEIPMNKKQCKPIILSHEVTRIYPPSFDSFQKPSY